MGLADQFNDKAQELEEKAMRARRIAMGEAEDEERERASETEEQAEQKSQDRSAEKTKQKADDA